MDIVHTLQANGVIYLIWVAVLSLLVGSFLNVVIYRLPRMMEEETREFCQAFLSDETEAGEDNEKRFNLMWPLSRCNQCNNTLKPWHNIPVFSYLFLRGKCAYCKTYISIRYPGIEILCCILSTYIAWHFGFSWQALAAMIFTWFLLCMTFIDFDTQLLPDSLTLGLVWIGLFVSLFSLFVFPHTAIIGAIVGYIVFWLFASIFKTITGKDGLGQGDFKLLAALGCWLGWQMLPVVVIISAVLGVIFAIIKMTISGESPRNNPIPYGPFLAVAGWICLIWGPQILMWYLAFLNGTN